MMARKAVDAEVSETALVHQGEDPYALIRIAVEGGAEIEKLEKLLDLKRQWDTDVARRAYVAAMAKAKAELPETIAKTQSANFGHGKAAYHYAELSDVVAAVVPVLSQHGFSHAWTTRQPDKSTIEVTLAITHEGGHSERVTLSSPLDTSGNKNPIQSLGSAVTYLQRYTLKAGLGIAEAGQDDDGHSAGRSPSGARTADPEAAIVLSELQSLLESEHLHDAAREWLRQAIPDRQRKGVAAMRKLRDGVLERIDKRNQEAARQALAAQGDSVLMDEARQRIGDMMRALPALEQAALNKATDQATTTLKDLLDLEVEVAKRIERHANEGAWDEPPPDDDEAPAVDFPEEGDDR